MANQEHRERLKQGVEAWNEWRADNPKLLIDLAGAYLGDKNLSGANLSEANLVKANFVGANLASANLSGADLAKANLIGATLAGAKLSGADLSKAHLVGANLSEAHLDEAKAWAAQLSNANLSGVVGTGADLNHAELADTDLRKAYLSHVNLFEAKLTRADMTGAELTYANLEEADLSSANLTAAVLLRTNFHRAGLYHTRLDGAHLRGTNFTKIDLSDTLGLDSCVHHGPSVLDYQTLLQSRNLPLQFLQGCGLPDRLIAYLPSISDEPIQLYSCFISYSTANQDFASRLYADLQSNGVRCWFAPHDMMAGKKIHEQIDEAIRVYDRLLLILSHESMSSPWVKTEIAKARKKELQLKRRVLFPLALVPFSDIRSWEQFDADLGDDAAKEIREYFLPDFSDWKHHDSYQRSLQKVLNALGSSD